MPVAQHQQRRNIWGRGCILATIIMKHLLSFIPALFVFVAFGQVSKDTTNKIRQLNIAMLTTSTVVLQKGIVDSDQSINFISLYDETGRPIENRFSNLKDSKATVYKFEYGKCNEYKRWEWLEYQHNQIDTIQVQLVSFNDKCQMEKIIWKDSTDSVTGIRYLTYDENERQIKEVDKNLKDELTAYVIYSYPDSLTIEKKGFFGDSSFWYHSREYFDTKGNRIYTSSFDEKGVETVDQGKTKYIYKGSKITEAIIYDLEGKAVTKTTYFYDVDGLVQRTISKSLKKDDDSETISTNRYYKRE